jgi:hypothetical protein
MESMRESWSDKRLDDLNHKVDRIDADVRAHRVETRTEFAALRGEMRDGFERVDARFERMDDRFERMDARLDARFDALHRLLIQLAALTIAALIGAIATQL